MGFARKKATDVHVALGLHDDGISFVEVEQTLELSARVKSLEFRPCTLEERRAVLKEMAKEHKLKNKTVTLCLPSSDYKLLTTTAPPVPDEELVAALQWDVKELIDESLENTTLDVFGIPGQEGPKKLVNVVAARKSAISSIADLMKESGINLHCIDIEELVLRNVAVNWEESQRGVMLVMLKPDDGMMVFVKDGQMYLSRRIEIGLKQLQANPEVKENLALEFQRSIDYFDRHYVNLASVKHVAVLPITGVTADFIEYLNQNLSLPVTMASMEQGLEWEKDIPDDMRAKCLFALGAALRFEGEEEQAA